MPTLLGQPNINNCHAPHHQKWNCHFYQEFSWETFIWRKEKESSSIKVNEFQTKANDLCLLMKCFAFLISFPCF